MCRKLGKGHPHYVCRKDNQYEVGADGVSRMRRMHNGARVEDHHGANVLNAYTDLRDKHWSWFPRNFVDAHLQKQSATKTKQLQRLERHTNHGMNRKWAQRKEHFKRNHVTRLGSLTDAQKAQYAGSVISFPTAG